jgi:hypothetical protein
MPRTIEGIVRGGRIELIDSPALAEGQRVQVVIEPQDALARPAAAGPFPEEGMIYTPLEDRVLIALLDGIRRTRCPLPPSPTASGRGSAAGMLADDATWDEHLRHVMELRKSDAYRETP